MLIFKKKDVLPELPPDIKEKIVLNFLDTLTKAGKGDGAEPGAELYATQIILNVMEETLQAIYKSSGESCKLTKEQNEALKARLLYKMMNTQEGNAALLQIIDFLVKLEAQNEK